MNAIYYFGDFCFFLAAVAFLMVAGNVRRRLRDDD